MTLPRSAWALGMICLVGQVLALAQRGTSHSDGTWVVLSMALSALLVGWISAGVLRARTGRLVLVWIIFGLELVAVLVSLATHPGFADSIGWQLLDAAAAIAQVVALGVFCASSYVRDLRARASGPRPGIGGLVLIAVTVGMLGGLTAAPDQAPGTRMNLRIGL